MYISYLQAMEFKMHFLTATKPCPLSHPFAFDAGKKCCSNITNSEDSSKVLGLYDRIEDYHCMDHIMCPFIQMQTLCTNKKFGMLNNI